MELICLSGFIQIARFDNVQVISQVTTVHIRESMHGHRVITYIAFEIPFIIMYVFVKCY